MGRWSQYDEDDHRLPEGMQRVGYDADSQRYTFQDAEGDYWQGAPGARYGELQRISADEATIHPGPHETGDIPAAAREHPWRMLAPFFLLVLVFLLVVFQFVNSGAAPTQMGHEAKEPVCGDGESVYEVQDGDSCWDIGQAQGLSVEELDMMNDGLDCDALGMGEKICVPE